MAGNKKRGPRSDFQGKHADFLLKFYPKYVNASKRGKTRTIWTDCFRDYWTAFPWRLPLKQDPNPDDPTDYSRMPETLTEQTEKENTIRTIEAVSGVYDESCM
jgi:hypothetical protein